jgi:hypothetical protein
VNDVTERRFGEIAARLLPQPGITEGTGFGTNPGLRVNGKIFAMLHSGRLTVKLPADRCAELVATGTAELLAMGTRRMREWVSISDARSDWVEIADEALAFVRR